MALGVATSSEPVFRAARNKAQLRIDIIDCVDQNLELCCSALNECHKELDESEGDETRNVVGQLFGLLTKCVQVYFRPQCPILSNRHYSNA